MTNKRHKPEEIVTKLRQVEVLVGQGKARIDAIREVRIPTTSPGNRRSDGSKAGHALTFKLHHSSGADQKVGSHPTISAAGIQLH